MQSIKIRILAVADALFQLKSCYALRRQCMAGLGFHRRLSVCLLIRTIFSTRVTKLDILMFHDESWKTIYFVVKR